ncbi:MAG TPA: energy transducer TonB, partial [Chloroflexota bacterium]|nr:energy transducer TonB [Chloroflexota bacterium]
PEPAAPKKVEAKKAEPKKKPAAKKPAAKTPEVKKVAPGVTVYKDTPPPTLRGKDGAPIPTTPDAYDVSSALPAKKK